MRGRGGVRVSYINSHVHLHKQSQLPRGGEYRSSRVGGEYRSSRVGESIAAPAWGGESLTVILTKMNRLRAGQRTRDTGQVRTGQVRTGEDRAGQGRTGQDRAEDT